MMDVPQWRDLGVMGLTRAQSCLSDRAPTQGELPLSKALARCELSGDKTLRVCLQPCHMPHMGGEAQAPSKHLPVRLRRGWERKY